MKILLVHNFYNDRGGEETDFSSLKQLLKEYGHKVITYTKDNRSIKNELLSKIKVAIGLFYNKEVDQGLSNLLKKHKPDLVQLENIYPLITPTAYRVIKKYGIPIIQRSPNYKLICPAGYLFKNGEKCKHNKKNLSIWDKLFHNCYKDSYLQSFILSSSMLYHKAIGSYDYVDKFLFPTLFTLKMHQKYSDIPKNKMTVIPTFTLIPKIKETKIRFKEYFLYASRLSEDKGILDLLEVFSTLPKLNLLVIGDGPLKEQVLKYNKYKNIEVQAYLHKKEEVLGYMKNAFMTIIPSKWYDVLPNVMLESFAVGIPVIAPKIGAFDEIVKDWQNGLKFEFGNRDDLKLVIIRSNKNKTKIFKMKSAIKTFFNENFLSANHYKSLIFLYEELSR